MLLQERLHAVVILTARIAQTQDDRHIEVYDCNGRRVVQWIRDDGVARGEVQMFDAGVENGGFSLEQLPEETRALDAAELLLWPNVAHKRALDILDENEADGAHGSAGL